MENGVVLIPQDVAEEGKDYLRERGYAIRMGRGTTPEHLTSDVTGCDAILARTEKITADVLEHGDRLKVVGRHGVGVDNVDVKRAEELGIYVTNTPDVLTGTVAEHAIGLMVALARNVVQCDRAVRTGRFSFRNHNLGMDLSGKVLGIVGMGRIGRSVAEKALYGFGMKVLCYDPHVEPGTLPGEFRQTDRMDALLESADVVSIHVPSSGDTRRILGERELAHMKRTAYLINTSRGDVIDEAALIRALEDEVIAGAALDVFENEPPDADNRLLASEKVILTPHTASLTKECMIRMALGAAQGIHEALIGQEPIFAVNHPAHRRTGQAESDTDRLR